MTREEFSSEGSVATICRRPFLKLWSHPAPMGSEGEKICDCLVVCGPDLVIISSLDNERKTKGGESGSREMVRAAFEGTVKRIREAERRLDSLNAIVRQDGGKVALPDRGARVYHRLAVSAGGRYRLPLRSGDMGDGFVHLSDDYGIGALLAQLDTITDLLEFLRASEAFLRSGADIAEEGGIEDLAALYVSNGNSFNPDPGSSGRQGSQTSLSGLWRSFCQAPEYADIRNELKISYGWDRLIDSYADYLLKDGMLDTNKRKVTKHELALATMALQPRRVRRLLAGTLMELVENPARKAVSRAVRGHGETAFVFLVGKGHDREHRSRELSLRCLVARGKISGVTTVVGIATDRLGTSMIGPSSDVSYLHIPDWSPEDEARVAGIQADLGYFNNVEWI